MYTHICSAQRATCTGSSVDEASSFRTASRWRGSGSTLRTTVPKSCLLLAGCLPAACWLLAGCLLAAYWLLAGCLLAASCMPTACLVSWSVGWRVGWSPGCVPSSSPGLDSETRFSPAIDAERTGHRRSVTHPPTPAHTDVRQTRSDSATCGTQRHASEASTARQHSVDDRSRWMTQSSDGCGRVSKTGSARVPTESERTEQVGQAGGPAGQRAGRQASG